MNNNIDLQLNQTISEYNNVKNQIASYKSQLDPLLQQNATYRARRDAINNVKSRIQNSFDIRRILNSQTSSYHALDDGMNGVSNKSQILNNMHSSYEKEVYSDPKISSVLSLLEQEISRLNQLIRENDDSINSCNSKISNYQNQENYLNKQITQLNYVKDNWN